MTTPTLTLQRTSLEEKAMDHDLDPACLTGPSLHYLLKVYEDARVLGLTAGCVLHSFTSTHLPTYALSLFLLVA